MIQLIKTKNWFSEKINKIEKHFTNRQKRENRLAWMFMSGENMRTE